MNCPGVLRRGCGVALPDDGRLLCNFDRRTLELVGDLVPGEEELGPQRFCRRCDEWWPLSAEYWQTVQRQVFGRVRGPVLVCRACVREGNRRAYERRRSCPQVDRTQPA